MGVPLDWLTKSASSSPSGPTLDALLGDPGQPQYPQSPDMGGPVGASLQGDNSDIQKPGGMKSNLKRMLSNFLIGGVPALGYPGDFAQEAKDTAKVRLESQMAQTEHIKALTNYSNQQTEMAKSMVLLPNGMQVPFALAQKLYPSLISADAKLAAGRYKTTPNGLFDTVTQAIVPGSGPDGVFVTPEIAGDNPALQQFIGRNIKWPDYNGATRAGAIGSTVIQGDQGPVTVNKLTGAAQPVTMGDGKRVGPAAEASARAAAKYGIAITQEGDTVSRLEALQQGLKLASTNPLIRPGLKAYEDAYSSDARMKQMQMQANDQTGASDMALLFNHIAMTGGNVKGMRMGEKLTYEHMHARGIPEELGVLYNHAVDGESLSPSQRQNFLKLAKEVRQTTWQRAAQEGNLYGIDPSMAQPDPDLDPIDLAGYAPKRKSQVPGKVRNAVKSKSDPAGIL